MNDSEIRKERARRRLIEFRGEGFILEMARLEPKEARE